MRLGHRLKLALANTLIRTIGRTSEGIRLCCDDGLTSGKTVDYVYRNQPSGRWLIGKMIDRRFLAHAGWEAVRARRRHVEQLLGESIGDLRGAGKQVSLIDIASGPALYILSVLQRVGEGDMVVRCRDLDERWLHEGRAAAQRLNLHNVRFERGDAFDRGAMLGLRPPPNLVVSSGFYDWITADDAVKESLALIFEALEPGGYVILTNQMAHPDLEFVTAVFVDFQRQPLRMTLRPVGQMHEWLEQVGFVVNRTLIDSWGYYSVTQARKPYNRRR